VKSISLIKVFKEEKLLLKKPVLYFFEQKRLYINSFYQNKDQNIILKRVVYVVEVKLIGANFPIRIIEELSSLKNYLQSDKISYSQKLDYAVSKLSDLSDHFTPEIISSAAARISRSTKVIDELIDEAWNDVAKARKSNEKIIYGLGHHSVADHGLFNYSVKDISRLLIESVEEQRIGVGYTERSQRYVTLDGDYLKPAEYSSADLERFDSLVASQNNFYLMAFNKIFENLKKQNSSKLKDLSGKEKRDFERNLEEKAKEDARYVLSLATKTQVVCSYQGQADEHTLIKLKNDRLLEAHVFADQMFDETVRIAPSFIQLAEPELFFQHTGGLKLKDEEAKYGKAHAKMIVKKLFDDYKHLLNWSHYKKSAKIMKDENVNLIRCKNIDGNVISSILFANSFATGKDSFALNYFLQKHYLAEEFIKNHSKYLSEFDKPSREYEINGGLIFEIALSAGAFGQFKRHRMMSVVSQDYDPGLGLTIPDTIREAGLEKEFLSIMNQSSDLYNDFLPKYGKASEYCLTNAHRKKILTQINLRELSHISRMRLDKHAQWDIKDIVKSMVNLTKQVAPLTSTLLCGKDEFDEVKEKELKKLEERKKRLKNR
jgi:thymidylate synthase ThyX